MTRHTISSMIVVLALAASMVLLEGCVKQHVAVYQNGINLGEWDLHWEGGGMVTRSGQRVIVSPAAGIPLDTHRVVLNPTHVRGGLVVVNQEPE